MSDKLARKLGVRIVTLFEDGVCIGQGELSPQGTVLDCAAPLSDDVFDALEDAIEDGESKLEIAGHEYTWYMP